MKEQENMSGGKNAGPETTFCYPSHFVNRLQNVFVMLNYVIKHILLQSFDI